ncbi:MAG: right-handed parallel beta-helix repeat-containing protein [Candidatus Pacearchaeota archaeon]
MKFLFIFLFGIILFSNFISAVDITACGNLSSANTIYILQKDVNSALTCFNITATNVTLDLNGFTVTYGNQNLSSNFYGVYSSQDYTVVKNGDLVRGNVSLVSQVRIGASIVGDFATIENLVTSNNTYGVYLENSANTSINELTAEDSQLYGIYVVGSNNTQITDTTASSNSDSGIYFAVNSHNLILTNIICNSNGGSGIETVSGAGSLTATGVTANSNNENGFLIATSGTSLNDVTANSNDNDGILLQGSNHILQDVTANSNSDDGFDITPSSNIILDGLIANENDVSGIHLRSSGNLAFSDITVNSNNYGIYFDSSSNNNFTNLIASLNENSGIYFYGASSGNIIKNSKIDRNDLYGLRFQHLNPNFPQYNRVYNNVINNSNNYFSSTNLVNYFNTTLTTATNIVNENYLGGNFWGELDRTGFSETCDDVAKDGLCDSIYNIDGVNYDYLPLDIPDRDGPAITVNVPLNRTYTTKSTTFNIAATDLSQVIWCNYSLNGNANISLSYFGGYWTAKNSSMKEGNHSVNFYCKDNKENLRLSTIYFTIDLPDDIPQNNVTTVIENNTLLPEKTTTVVLNNITASKEVISLISIEGIYLTRIITLANQNIGLATLAIKTINNIIDSDLITGLSEGDVYQGLQINVTGIDADHIESITFEFKIAKTWLVGRNVSQITFQRKADTSTEWEMLNTDLINEDDDYYYFSAVSPGFSLFAIYFDKDLCTPGELFCSGDALKLCEANRSSSISEDCEFGCSDGECLSYWEQSEDGSVFQESGRFLFGIFSDTGSIIFTILVVIIFAVLVFVSFITYKICKKKGIFNSKKN